MDTTQLNDRLRDIFRAMPKAVAGGSTGWVNLANFGKELISNDIDFHVMGFAKLREFVESLDLFEIYKDITNALPVYYIRLKDDGGREMPFNMRGRKLNPVTMLTGWAFLGHYPSMIETLKNLALEEEWSFGEDGGEPYPILSNYIKYTFYKLQREGNKVFVTEDGEYAVFNTGLVDRRYLPIYALFRKNRREDIRQKWYLVNYCIEGEERAGKTLVSQFSKLPAPARYFDSVADMVYDTRAGKPVLDIEHIIVERVDRLPDGFIRRNAPAGFEVRSTAGMDADERAVYYDALRDAIRDDMECYRNMAARLEEALVLSLRRIKWNYRTAVPVYYPAKDRMCLLIPLCLLKDSVVDAALVVSRTQSGRYQGETVYSLDWAYKCARLVYHVDSDWLKVGRPSDGDADDADDDDVSPESSDPQDDGFDVDDIDIDNILPEENF